MINDNNQDSDNIGQSFILTSINQGDNGLFIPTVTMDLCMIFDHHQIDYIKQSLGTHLNILSYDPYILLSAFYYNPSIYYCCILSKVAIVFG